MQSELPLDLVSAYACRQQVPNPLRGMARGGRVIELTADRTLLAYGSNQQKFKDALMKLPEVADFHEEPVPRSGWLRQGTTTGRLGRSRPRHALVLNMPSW
jgi:hypothetical protein